MTWSEAIDHEFGQEVKEKIKEFLSDYENEDEAWNNADEIGREILTLYFETYGD